MSELENTADLAPAPRQKKKMPKLLKSSLAAKKARTGWLFVLPFVVGLILVYLPILIDSFCFSFLYVTEGKNGARIVTNLGISAYRSALNTEFLKVLLQGFQQLILNVPAILVFSLFIAVILNQKMVGRAAFRAIFFIPVILATGLMDSVNASDTLSGSTSIDDGSGSASGTLISMMDVEALFSNMKVGTELVQYVIDLVNRVYSIVNYSGADADLPRGSPVDLALHLRGVPDRGGDQLGDVLEDYLPDDQPDDSRQRHLHHHRLVYPCG